jgi:hypothetical protein
MYARCDVQRWRVYSTYHADEPLAKFLKLLATHSNCLRCAEEHGGLFMELQNILPGVQKRPLE